MVPLLLISSMVNGTFQVTVYLRVSVASAWSTAWWGGRSDQVVVFGHPCDVHISSQMPLDGFDILIRHSRTYFNSCVVLRMLSIRLISGDGRRESRVWLLSNLSSDVLLTCCWCLLSLHGCFSPCFIRFAFCFFSHVILRSRRASVFGIRGVPVKGPAV